MIQIYTDGACRGNQGQNNIGSWGVHIVDNKNNIKELYGATKNTTNNIMEMTAVLYGLKTIKNKNISIEVLSDSQYTIDGITKWIKTWKQKNWKTSDKKDVMNKDLWIQLDNIVQQFKSIKFTKVKGHSDCIGNNRADELCNEAMNKLLNNTIKPNCAIIVTNNVNNKTKTNDKQIKGEETNMNNNNIKRNPEFLALSKITVDDNKTLVTGYVDAWTFANQLYNGAAYKEIGLQNNGMISDKELVELNVGCYLHVGKLRYAFGDDYVNTLNIDEDDCCNVYINIKCWDLIAKRIKMFNPQPGQKIGFFGQFKVEHFIKKDNTNGMKLVLNVYDFKSVYKKK